MNQYPHATISGLKKYVSKRVRELSKGQQMPSTRNETRQIDWQVW
jgi:hypothetical protein